MYFGFGDIGGANVCLLSYMTKLGSTSLVLNKAPKLYISKSQQQCLFFSYPRLSAVKQSCLSVCNTAHNSCAHTEVKGRNGKFS